MRCPRSAHHRNGDAHPSCRLNPDKNTWFCDVCQHGGGVKDLARELGVDLRKLAGSSSPKRSARRKTDEKLPLVFVSEGPISETIARRFSEIRKAYPAATWEAFQVVAGRVHPEGLPDRSEPAIAFPMPDGGFHVYRYTRADKKRRWCFANKGVAGLLTVGFEREGAVLLCEGEWDAMRAYELGYAVATGTGAGTFKSEWAGHFAGRTVVVVYDVDNPGREGAFKVKTALTASGVAAVDLRLPLSGNIETDGKDLSDYVEHEGPDAFRKITEEALEGGLKGNRGCVRVEGGVALLIRMGKAFPGLVGALHAALAAAGYLALSGTNQPLAIFLMGPPSSGKTLVIRLFFTLASNQTPVYRCDDFTKASFVSRAATVPAKKLADIDLLPKIEDKLLLTKELAPIFRGKEDELVQLFSVLTSVLDGEGYVTAGGSVGTRGYDRPIFFCWIGGTTPFSNQTWKVMAALGPRILFYSTAVVDPTIEELIAAQGDEQSTVELDIRREVNEFLERFFTAKPPRSVPERSIRCKDAARRQLALYAQLTARLRAGLSMKETEDRADGESRYSPPEKEQEYRLVRTLNRLAKGSALILGRDEVNQEDLLLVRDIALSSGPENRRKAAKALLELTRRAVSEGESVDISVRAIATAMNCSLPTARHYAEELHVLKIAEYAPGSKGDPEGGRLQIVAEFSELAR